MKREKILLIMPPFLDPLCPPLGISVLKSYLAGLGWEVHIRDFNTDPSLFGLKRRYFSLGTDGYFPHWRNLNIFRNGPRYLARHQLAWLLGHGSGDRYADAVRRIIDFDGRSIVSGPALRDFDELMPEIFGIVREKTRSLIEKLGPDVVGCTCLETTFPAALAVLREAKEMDPGIRTILGGAGMLGGDRVESGNAARVLEKCGWVDTVIYGEGERLLEHHLKGAFRGKRILANKDLADLPGPGPYSFDIGKSPPPDFEGLDLSRYLMLSSSSSRGCPFACGFCFETVSWGGYRRKEIGRFVEELIGLAERCGRDRFYICDSLINPVADELSSALLRAGSPVEFDSYVRIGKQSADPARVRRWARGGMVRARIGIESASQRVLKLMNKSGYGPELAARSLESLAKNGIAPTALMIAGFPGESSEDFEETLAFLRANHADIWQADISEFACSPDGLKKPSGTLLTVPEYPEECRELLVLEHPRLKGGIPRKERFRRIELFEKTRSELGIPCPYSLFDMYEADTRWAELGHRSG